MPSQVSKDVEVVGTARHTVACNNKELVLGGDLVDLDVGEGSDNLLLRRQIGALLELKVTYRAGQGEVAVDAAKVDEAAGRLDAGLLGWGESVGSKKSVAED